VRQERLVSTIKYEYIEPVAKAGEFVRATLLKKMEQSNDLPPLPEILHRVDQILQDSERSLSDAVELIASEVALSGRILNVANSVYYGGGRQVVTSLIQACNRLGSRNLRSLVYSFELLRLFRNTPAINQRMFWRHNFVVALYSNAIARHLKLSLDERDRAYIAGLAHDIGVMIFATLIPNEYERFLETTKLNNAPLYLQEQERFGIDHSELGARFVEYWWHFEPEIVESVLNHHLVNDNPPEKPSTKEIVYLANTFCSYTGINIDSHWHRADFPPELWEQYHISVNAQLLSEEVVNSLTHAEELLRF
jgi:HD-like signal output (HDOD) protein